MQNSNKARIPANSMVSMEMKYEKMYHFNQVLYKGGAMVSSIDARQAGRPVGLKLINAAGRMTNRFGICLPKLEEQSLLDHACKKTALHDFGDDGFRDGLRMLLRALKSDARLNQMGRILAYTQITDLLKQRLQLIDHWKKHPEVAAQPVEKPLFVLGLPRTGTTILYNLLAQDPACRSPLSWEVAQPCPPPLPDSYNSDPRIQVVGKQLGMLNTLIPGFDAIHPVGAQLPQECISIMAYDFHSVQFELNFDIPTYQQWYAEQDLRPTYQFHRQFLQHLQSRYAKEYWVLKTPAHLGAIDAILAVYPDARIVQTHRDPLKVLPSTASLYYALRTLCSDEVDPHALGIQQVNYWADSLQRGMDARDKLQQHADQFYDVQFNDLMADPFACIRAIYQHFDMQLSGSAEQCMRDFLKANTREKHGHHSYSLEMFGLDKQLPELNKKFETYRHRFNIPDSVE
jgi:hypothetical protein